MYYQVSISPFQEGLPGWAFFCDDWQSLLSGFILSGRLLLIPNPKQQQRSEAASVWRRENNIPLSKYKYQVGLGGGRKLCALGF